MHPASSSSLTEALTNRRGLSNLVRLVAALGVLLSHSYPLSGSGPDPMIGNSPLGEISVSIFFALSGYFVFRSALSHNFKTFVILRISRLFPALITTNFFIAFVIGPALAFFSSYDNYWRVSDGPIGYFSYNSTLWIGLQSNLSGLFSRNSYPNVINGSLWTLPTELRCYVICSVVAILIKRFKSVIPLYAVFSLISLVYIFGLIGSIPVQETIPVSTSRLLLVFFSGALANRIDFTPKNGGQPLIWVSFFAFIFTVCVSRELASLFYWILIPVIATTPTQISRNFEIFRDRDFSYGFYLWAFPIQQFVMHLGLIDSAIKLSITAVLLTFVFAAGSWFFVEKPTMSRARRFAL